MKIKKFLKSHPVFYLFQSREKVCKKVDADFQRFGVSYSEAIIISALYFEKNPPFISEITGLLGCSKSFTSLLLKSMVEKSLVEIKASSHDKRYKQVSLTESGRNLSPKVISCFEDLQNKIEKINSKNHIMSTVQTIKKLNAKLY